MESFLIAAAVTSFVVGAAMILFAWNIVLQNRRREAARVELLSGLAFFEGVPAELDRPFRAPEAPERDERPQIVHIVEIGKPTSPAIDEFPSERSLETRTERVAEATLQTRHEETMPIPAEEMTTTETLFREPEKSGAASRRTIALAAVAVVMLVAIGAYKLFSGPRPMQTHSEAVAAPASVAHHESRIELLALDHRTSSAGFVVTGRLRNPADGASLQNVIAVVDVLDRDGRVLTTASAPIKQAVLNAGESSEFLVAAADAPKVARYRVEFYAKGGEPIPQIDLRNRQVSLATAK
jgi:hypothetical protein